MNGSFRVPLRQALDLNGAMNYDFINAPKLVGCDIVHCCCMGDQDDILSIRFALDPETGRVFALQINRSSDRVIPCKVAIP